MIININRPKPWWLNCQNIAWAICRRKYCSHEFVNFDFGPNRDFVYRPEKWTTTDIQWIADLYYWIKNGCYENNRHTGIYQAKIIASYPNHCDVINNSDFEKYGPGPSGEPNQKKLKCVEGEGA